MISMDYGVAGKLVFYTANGVLKLPRLAKRAEGGARSPAESFAEKFAMALDQDDVVTESATIGSCGAEPELIRKVVENSGNILYTLSGRTVKNYVKTRNLDTPNDIDSARILYLVATTNKDALQVWKHRTDKFTRKITSVRPYDKRGYKGTEVDSFMSALAPFDSLPESTQTCFGSGDYNRATSLPFAMAFSEEGSQSRNGYERIIGLYGHGYPSFYRRATVDLMQSVAKELSGAKVNADVTPAQRKEAWKVTRREIRRLHHLSVKHQKG